MPNKKEIIAIVIWTLALLTILTSCTKDSVTYCLCETEYGSHLYWEENGPPYDIVGLPHCSEDREYLEELQNKLYG